MVLRMATAADAPALLEIYAPCVTETSITFETEVPSVEEFASRITATTAFYPWLVCEADGAVAGYAYASQHRARAAYRWSADLSVYVAPQFHRRGVATALYSAVLELLRRQGFYTAFAAVTSPNPASEAFHDRFGFRRTGVFENDGFKLGEWHGVTWFQLALREYGGEPAPVVPVGEVITDGSKEAGFRWKNTI